MDKIIYNISSYNRKNSLIKSIESIYNQCDVINVSLNSYDEIPSELYDEKINLFITNNEKGDAYKFLNLVKSNGYYFTIDDDLIYPNNYTDFMINKIEQYNRKSIITLHGRNFRSYPIKSYYNNVSTEVLHFNKNLEKDKQVQFGGTGLMAFHTNLFKVDFQFFKYPNMADIWIGKYAKENNISIICAEHSPSFITQQTVDETIFGSGKRNDILQTQLANQAYKTKDLSVIIPTYGNLNYLYESIQSVLNSSKNNDTEILVGIDGCQETKNFVLNNEFDSRIRFFYFEKNIGPYIIKNTLSKLSNSEILLFFDSDDVMTETMISEIIKLQKSNEFVKPMYLDFNYDLKNVDKNIKTSNQFGEGVFSIKKNLFLEMNGFEGWKCAADSEFMKRLFKNNKKFSYTNQILFYRRNHATNLTVLPETNFKSELRHYYFKLSKRKKNFGPLPELIVENFYEIYSKAYSNDLNPNWLKLKLNMDVDKGKLETISKLTLNRQVIKPIIQEKKTDIPDKKEYVTVDNTPAINNLMSKRGNPVTVQTQQSNPVKTNQTNPIIVKKPINNTTNVQKNLVNQKRAELMNLQQKVKPDGFKEKPTYKKGNMNRRGGSFDF